MLPDFLNVRVEIKTKKLGDLGALKVIFILIAKDFQNYSQRIIRRRKKLRLKARGEKSYKDVDSNSQC